MPVLLSLLQSRMKRKITLALTRLFRPRVRRRLPSLLLCMCAAASNSYRRKALRPKRLPRCMCVARSGSCKQSPRPHQPARRSRPGCIQPCRMWRCRRPGCSPGRFSRRIAGLLPSPRIAIPPRSQLACLSPPSRVAAMLATPAPTILRQGMGEKTERQASSLSTWGVNARRAHDSPSRSSPQGWIKAACLPCPPNVERLLACLSVIHTLCLVRQVCWRRCG